MGYRRENEIGAVHGAREATRNPRLTREPACDSTSYMAWLRDEAALQDGEAAMARKEAAYLAWWEEVNGR